MTKPIYFIVGPTATRKSQIAIRLAKKIGGEIVSADSMQIYRGMDIGTAKPTRAERRTVPHHLFDIVDPNRSFSVYDFRRRALKTIRDIFKRNKIPIIVGGSGLYVRVLLQGFSGQPGADQKLRKELEQRSRTEGLDSLYSELQKADPARASQIDPTDKRRIIRALEIFRRSGLKPTTWYEEQEPLARLGYQPHVIGIQKDRPALYADINKRVDQMFRKGLVREVRRLMKMKLSKTASVAVGYKEVIDALREGRPLEEAKEAIKRNTRRLAKRQTTWFKREKDIHWVMWNGDETLPGFSKRVLHIITSKK